MAEEKSKTARRISGKVVSDKMNQTVTVLIERRVKHPLYSKIMTKTTKLHAHDAGNSCKEGDFVTIEECRPLSKTKSWRLVSINDKAS